MPKKWIALVALLAAPVALAACYSKPVDDLYSGMPRQELLDRMGEPDSTLDLPNQQVLWWRNRYRQNPPHVFVVIDKDDRRVAEFGRGGEISELVPPAPGPDMSAPASATAIP